MKGLPWTAAQVWRDDYLDRSGGWTVTDQLIATVADRLDLLHRDLHGIARSKRVPRPNLIERPGTRKHHRQVSWAEAARQLNAKERG